MARPPQFRVPVLRRPSRFVAPAGPAEARPPAPRVRGTAAAVAGALLGALLGAVAWIVVGMFGFVSPLPGLAVAFLAAAGWDRFRGANGASPGKGAAVALCTSAAIVLAERIALEAQLHESWLALLRMLPSGAADGLSYGALRAATLAPGAPLWPAFHARLAVALGVGAAGCAGVVAAAGGRRDGTRPARSLASAALAALVPAFAAAALTAFLPEGAFSLGSPRGTFRTEPFRLSLRPSALAVSPAAGGGVRVPFGFGDLPAPEGFAPAVVPDAPVPDPGGLGETVPVARFVRGNDAEATAFLASATVWRRCDAGWFGRACDAALAAAGGASPIRRETVRLDFAVPATAADAGGGSAEGCAATVVSLAWRAGLVLRMEVRAHAPSPGEAEARATAALAAWADGTAGASRNPAPAEELAFLASRAGPDGLLSADDFGAPSLRRAGVPRSLLFLAIVLAVLVWVVRFAATRARGS